MDAVPDAVVHGVGRPSEPPDAEVIAQSQRVPESFSLIFDRYFGQLRGYVARRLGDGLADDVAAETFLVAFRERGQYDVMRGPVRAWLYGITTNLVRRHRRHEVRSYRALTRVEIVNLADSHEERVADRVSVAGMRRQLAGALAELSPGDRDVLLLVALADLTYEEVAAALGIAYGTVCSRLNRARREVRKALGTTNPITEEGTDHG
jgi:RNA polymerase sigma-70 factor (ECF subfamily)